MAYFAGLPIPFEATRYHSLIVRRETLPDELEVVAETSDREIMGLRHRQYPVHGVQFHPESIMTGEGKKLLANFLPFRFLRTFYQPFVSVCDLASEPLTLTKGR